MELTGKQKAFLRSLAHHEDVIIQIGKLGITPTLVQSVKEALTARELVKVRVLQNCEKEPKDILPVLAKKCRAELVQVIGRNGILYQENTEKKKIELP